MFRLRSGYLRAAAYGQRGFAWLAAGKAVAVTANAALLIAVARLLEVADFGLFSAAVGRSCSSAVFF